MCNFEICLLFFLKQLYLLKLYIFHLLHKHVNFLHYYKLHIILETTQYRSNSYTNHSLRIGYQNGIMEEQKE